MNLFDPVRIGTLETKNHFLRSATYEGAATEDGRPTDKILSLYQDLARGGVGIELVDVVGLARRFRVSDAQGIIALVDDALQSRAQHITAGAEGRAEQMDDRFFGRAGRKSGAQRADHKTRQDKRQAFHGISFPNMEQIREVNT